MAEERGVAATPVQGRPRQQFYSGKADWKAVAAVKAAVAIPVIVNGDITDVASARDALSLSGADAVMIGRGAYGRPWIADSINRALDMNTEMSEPGFTHRLDIALTHFGQTLRFYGDALGLKVFRKHLGWYVEQASRPADPQQRRVTKSHLCRIDTASGVEAALTPLWT